MSRAFWDTSALMKLCKTEPGSAVLQDKINETKVPIFVSQLAIVEFTSVSYRRLRKGLYDLTELQRLHSVLAQLVLSRKFAVLPVSKECMLHAEKLIQSYGQTLECQTYDAIHLATALDLNRRVGIGEFVSADRALLSLARSLGLTVVDPETV